jgi:RimJ/RimL family protein N-acetyltransferase
VKVIDIEAEDAANGHMIDRLKFPNALSHEPEQHGRPTVLAAVAYRDGDIAGIAGVTKDSDFMYQIGIDVLPEHRGNGLAPAMTSAAARAVFDIGGLPYYCTSNSNILSMRTALAVGFRPTWVEVLTRPA